MMSLAPDAPDYLPLGDALQVPPEYHSWKLVTPESVEAAHKAGIEVHVWTVDDPGGNARPARDWVLTGY